MSEKQEHDVATREEALAILTEHARNGSPTAAAALARVLRARETHDRPTEEELALQEELESLIATKPDRRRR